MSSRVSSATMAEPTVRTAKPTNIGSTMCGPPVCDYYLYIAVILWLDFKLLRCIDQVFLCERGELVIVCHEKSVKRAGIHAQPAEHTLTVVYLRHDSLLVLLPVLVHFDHSYRLCNTF